MLHFYWSFSDEIMAVKGLRCILVCRSYMYSCLVYWVLLCLSSGTDLFKKKKTLVLKSFYPCSIKYYLTSQPTHCQPTNPLWDADINQHSTAQKQLCMQQHAVETRTALSMSQPFANTGDTCQTSLSVARSALQNGTMKRSASLMA